MNKKILVITPIKHLQNVESILSSIPNSDLIYLPNCEIKDFKIHDDSFAIFTNPNKSNIFLGKKNLASFKNLKYICTASTGTVHIDKSFCKEKGINIISLTEERHIINKIPSTAEHAFALMLSSLRNINLATKSITKNEWDYEPFLGRQIKSLTIGVIGYGRLGNFFSNYCDNFGAKVIVYDPYKSVNHPRIQQVQRLDEIARYSDVISLHVHVTKETDKMINIKFLNKCKKSILIVNTSRGEIIKEDDLTNFLSQNESAKYATDVLSDEINGICNNPIKKYFDENPTQVIITPHIGGMTKEAQNMAFGHAANLLKETLLNEKI
ncbi:MAG: hydroxyacid dehydrogenase [Flavobacteriales bacterium]|nr:hydroxyacid dehydrogenase [Flavobacteriales bacterium]